MSATERLYLNDSHRTEFEARVVAAFERDGKTYVELDRTAFYPTGGGQPHDTGTLSGAEGEWHVDEVTAGEGAAEGQVQETGERVLHRVSRDLSQVGEAARLPQPGDLLAGKVDLVRRRDHLQQHTGQHILSQAFVQAAGIETKSFHLGALTSTIDVDPRVTDEIAAKAVAIANDVVFGDVPLRVHEVGPDELARFKVRRQTFHGERIRLVEIEGFDVSTCGGTHAHRSGEVGLIAVLSVEKAKGLHRVEFVCGGRALRALQSDHAVVQQAARALSTGADAVVAQVQKLVEQNLALRKRTQTLFAASAGAQAAELLEKAKPRGTARVVSAVLHDLSLEDAQLLAKKIVDRPAPIVALLGLADAAAPKLLFARSNDPALASLAMGPLIKSIAERFGGRGGGSPGSAQASIARASELEAALGAACESLPE